VTELTYSKKLIEVALPLDAINREAAREKSIRHGHPSTLHLWWARRPLAACRAVLFAQLVDDPSAHPDRFPTEAAQEQERQRLFGIIERLVKWENSTNEDVLEEARAEIRRSCGDDPPPILDPFAGGGSIPLEAQRLGLEAYASDLNPVAVLINKALIEIPPRWADQPPVHPRDEGRLDTQSWKGAQGLADDVRYYGQWMRDEAERRIGHLYPRATLPDGSTATVIAWIWARTVVCPNPACGAEAPLVRSFWLGKKKGKEAWVNPVVDGKQVRFEIGHGKSGPPVEGTVERSGATCLVCGESIGFPHIRAEGQAGRIGAQLMAIVAEGNRQRLYLPPTGEQQDTAHVDRPDDVPESELPHNPRDFKTPNYGMTHHADLFTNRQLVALTTFSDLVGEARARVQTDAIATGLTSEDATAYADAIATYLALGVSRLADIQNSLCRWENTRSQVRNLFARQAVPMVWDFAEGGAFSGAAGDFGVSLGNLVSVIERSPSALSVGQVEQSGASERRATRRVVISTDPPYYDNIGYSDLSDFFYVWLRRSLQSVYPDLFRTLLTPKAEELVATPYRFEGSKEKAEQHFEEGFVRVFATARDRQVPGVPLTLFYAFKQSETDSSDGAMASTGWETMLAGLLSAGLMVTATWPMRTELANKVGAKANMLASSIVLACRPRSESAGITDRRGFLEALRLELPAALREMQQGSIAPVDLAQSSVGPGMAVFSRYAKVLEPSGEPMRVRAALGLINQVLDEVLAEHEGDFDPQTRWAVKWFSQFGFDAGPFGDAETLCKATGTAVDGMQRSGIVESRASKVWLVGREDLPGEWDPLSDGRVPVWEATQHLVKALDEGGEAAAAGLLSRLGGVGETARDLAYRLYAICDQKKWAKEAGAYNALVTSWPEIRRKASTGTVGQGSLLGSEERDR
jgi:putative DNA methylase